MRISKLLLPAATACALLGACQQSGYIAEVKDLQLVRMDPATGYSGAIVKVLGRNFSTKASDNVVTVGDKRAKVLDATAWDLTIQLPEQEPGIYTVSVQTPKGTQSGLSFEYKFKPEHVYIASVFAGNGKNANLDGIGTSAGIAQPEGIIPDGDGAYYLLIRGANNLALRKFDKFGQVSTITTSGDAWALPWQGAMGPGGNLYVAFKANGQMAKVSPKGEVKVLGGFALTGPMGCDFDTEGNGYLADRDHKLGDSKGQVVKFKDDAPVAAWPVNTATCVAVDSKDRVIVGSQTAGVLYMLEKDGSPVAIAGDGTKPSSKNSYSDGEYGSPLTAKIGCVNGIYVATDGALYFTDITYQTVRRLSPDSDGDYSKGVLETIAEGFYPSDIVVTDDCSKIYVSSATKYAIYLIEVI